MRQNRSPLTEQMTSVMRMPKPTNCPRRTQRLTGWMLPIAFFAALTMGHAALARAPQTRRSSAVLQGAVQRDIVALPAAPEQALAFAQAAYNDRVDYACAVKFCDLALAQYRRADNAGGVAEALAQKGQALEAQGEFARARSCYTEALRLRTGLKQPLCVAHVLELLSGLAQRRGEYSQAERMLKRSEALRRQGRDTVGVALCLRDQGILEADQGHYPAGAACYRACLRLIAPLHKPEIEAHVQELQGRMARDRGDFVRARRLFLRCNQFWKARNHARWIANTRRDLALTAFYEQKDRQAESLLRASLTAYYSVGDKESAAETGLILARVLAHQGKRGEAARLLPTAWASRGRTASPLFQARAWEAHAEMLARSQPKQAAALLTRARAWRVRANCPLSPVEQARWTRILDWFS